MSRHKNLQKYIDEEEDDFLDYDDDEYYDDEYAGDGNNLDDIVLNVQEIKFQDAPKQSKAIPTPSTASDKQGKNSNAKNMSKFGEVLCSSPNEKKSLSKNAAAALSNNGSEKVYLFDDVSDLASKGKKPAKQPISKQSSQTSLKEEAPSPTPAPKVAAPTRKKFDYSLLEKSKKHLNLIVVGHVDAGKSTMVGHLLVLAREVDSRTFQKFERESEKIGKGSFAYAWVMDETDDERNRGITIDVGVTKLELPDRIFTLLDSPGHKDFVPNMLSGASQADVAILVIDAGRGAFESGFDARGQTREHALLLRSMGISQVIVAINKLDTVAWSKDRYDEIKERFSAFLSQIGFRKESVKYVPCSGLAGINLLEKAKESEAKELLDWYRDGPSLIDLMNQFEVPERPYSKPVRISLSDFFKGTGANAVAISGRVESGVIQTNDKLAVMPINEIVNVKSITKDGQTCDWAAAGDLVLLNCTGVDINQMSMTYVLSSINDPIQASDKLIVQLVTFDIKIPLISGSSVLFHHGSISEEAVISKIIGLIDKSTGEVEKNKKAPRCIPRNTTAQLEITIKRRVCVERYRDLKELGRFTLRIDGESIGAGIIVDRL